MQGMNNNKNFCPATAKIVQQFRESINSQFIDKCSQAISRENTSYWIKRCLVVVNAMTCNSVKEIEESAFLSTKSVRTVLKAIIGGDFDVILRTNLGGRKKKECSAETYHLIDALFGLRPDDLVNAGFFHNCELANSLKGRQTWTIALLAKAAGTTYYFMQQWLKNNNIKLTEKSSYCVSDDALYTAKMRYIDYCYKQAEADGYIVLCFDEKPTIAIHHIDSHLNDGGYVCPSSRYERFGTTNLLALLRPATGQVIAELSDKKTAQDIMDFISKAISRPEFAGRKIIIIMDNLSVHRKAEVDLLNKYENLTITYTPTNASWANLVECFFSVFNKQFLSRSNGWTSRTEFINDAYSYINGYNERANPYNWSYDFARDLNQRSQRQANITNTVDVPDFETPIRTALNPQLQAALNNEIHKFPQENEVNVDQAETSCIDKEQDDSSSKHLPHAIPHLVKNDYGISNEQANQEEVDKIPCQPVNSRVIDSVPKKPRKTKPISESKLEQNIDKLKSLLKKRTELHKENNSIKNVLSKLKSSEDTAKSQKLNAQIGLNSDRICSIRKEIVNLINKVRALRKEWSNKLAEQKKIAQEFSNKLYDRLDDAMRACTRIPSSFYRNKDANQISQ